VILNVGNPRLLLFLMRFLLNSPRRVVEEILIFFQCVVTELLMTVKVFFFLHKIREFGLSECPENLINFDLS
jgi:hypothetical protein